MNKDYYQDLGLKRDATAQQIASNYKNLILRWHPKLAKEDQKTAQFHFATISEAYEVLSDPLKRAFYDRYGWKKLQQGLFTQGQLKGGYRFSNKPDQIFEQFFHSNNTLAKDLEKHITQKGSLFSHAFGALNYQDEYPNSDLIVNVPCSLSQLYEGVAKKVQYTRNVLNQDGRTLCNKKEYKLLQLKPGYGISTELRFKQQGNETINRKKSDLLFKITQLPHEYFSRQGEDLLYNHKISLAQALQCQPIQITTLDNRRVRLGIDQIPNPSALKQISGQGMPILGSKKRGNLYIKFDIQFPKNLAQEVRQQLRKLLK